MRPLARRPLASVAWHVLYACASPSLGSPATRAWGGSAMPASSCAATDARATHYVAKAAPAAELPRGSGRRVLRTSFCI